VQNQAQVYTSARWLNNRWRVLVLPLLLALAAPVPAQEPSPEQLDALRERIASLQAALEEDLQERDRLRDALRRTEERIGQLAAEKRRLTDQLAETEVRLKKLEQRQQTLAREKAEQIDWLVRTVRASYMSGRQETVKLLLNQEQPDRIARLLRYQEYFREARTERVHILNKDLDQLREVSIKVNRTRDELAQRRRNLEQRSRELEQAKRNRESALAKMDRELGRDRQTLAELREDEKRLEKLLQDMARSLSDIPARPGGKPFADLTGKLPWPVSGTMQVGFGQRREGALRWNGVVLNAPSGDPVRAIHGGRVVYADWLRGYGLLTILDHGDGYLSLYGYNQSLLRDVGEWVSTGEVLALAGNSGGRSETGVYFEIRRQGKPVDPDRWCSRRVTLPPIARKPS
jgi:septal ring factor EnvC (AmiA/AmiB activator)